MGYTHVQLIAHHMYTLPSFKTRFHLPSVDARMRMYRIFEVMKYCSGQLKNDQATTLKIFVAPEFYGKSFDGKSDGTGHYDPGAVWRSFEALREKCQQDGGFQHWLVIPGTFVTAEKVGNQTVIFNSAYIFMGGGSPFRIIHKKDFSTVDGLMIALRGGNKLYKQLPEVLRGTPTQQSTPIQVDNLRVGIEICRDHYLARLKNSLAKKTKNNPPAVKDGVDVQVLTVCGISVGDNAVATRNKGYVFRVEGHPPDNQLPLAAVERFQVTWQNQIMDKNVDLYGFDPGTLEDLPSELQLNSACNPSSLDACSSYIIYNALPIQTV